MTGLKADGTEKCSFFTHSIPRVLESLGQLCIRKVCGFKRKLFRNNDGDGPSRTSSIAQDDTGSVETRRHRKTRPWSRSAAPRRCSGDILSEWSFRVAQANFDWLSSLCRRKLGQRVKWRFFNHHRDDVDKSVAVAMVTEDQARPWARTRMLHGIAQAAPLSHIR